MKNLFDRNKEQILGSFVTNLVNENKNSFNQEAMQNKIKLNRLLIVYFEKYGKNIKNDYFNFLPVSFDLLNCEEKIRILNECLENNIMIEDSKFYCLSLEGTYRMDEVSNISK